MKLYTSKEQTKKLIELGLPLPIPSGQFVGYYTIGDLIMLLPPWIDVRGGLEIVVENGGWLVMHGHDPFDPYCKKPELIDALYEYCVKLKEEEEDNGKS